MWKYVTRRLKETIERAYNVLDIRTTWTCGAQQTSCGLQSPLDEKCEKDKQSPSEPGQILNSTSACILFRFWDCPSKEIQNFTRSSNENSNDGHREKNENRQKLHEGEEDQYQHHQKHIQRDLLNAITWSGAIICGWYASQLASLNWRQFYWEDQHRRYYKHLQQVPSRKIHTSVSPQYTVNPSVQFFPITKKALEEHFTFKTPSAALSEVSIIEETSTSASSGIYEISNDSGEISSSSPPKKDLPPKKQTLKDAVNDFVVFLGDTEYRIGLNQIRGKNYKSAVEHLKLATNHNHPEATFTLGVCYEKGLGVKKNLRSAMKCYQVAASMGHSKAIFNLGVFYGKGIGGLEKDEDVAKQCFITAANLGRPEAKSVLSSDRENIIN